MVGAESLQAALTSKATLSTRTRLETKSPPEFKILVMVGAEGLIAKPRSKHRRDDHIGHCSFGLFAVFQLCLLIS
jgi:hypothetical protein